MPRARPSQLSTASTPRKPSLKIPLNDDRQEKANRLQSRQALHEQQLKQLKAAATPNKKGSRLSIGGASPSQADNNDSDLMITSVGGSAVKPMKHVPIMADFEEWIKLATDNKINATNSWNFALIDYFHDMTLLKEGEGVNFQKASCTLDGCVKIYTNRVDSVATDTGKLLSGLADSGNNKKQRGDGEGDAEGEDDDEEEGEDATKRKKKRTQRHAEATLASSFAQLQLKKMELEFSVDPLFKKASADFDEGGAKGLLLNHLAIDGEGRIVFDSSDDAQHATAEDNREGSTAPEEDEGEETVVPTEAADIDIAALGAKFFPDLAKLDEQDICPSLKTFDLGDPAGSTDLPFLKAPEDWRQDKEKSGVTEDDGEGERSGVVLDSDNALGFDDDDDMGLGGFDIPVETGFGEGGDAWAKEAALDHQMRVHRMPMGNPDDDGEGGATEGNTFGTDQQYSVTLAHRGEDHETILNYFDQALQKNWAGPEHWKIRRIKDLSKPGGSPQSKRKEKEPFEIDFAAPMSQALADSLYSEALSKSSISLPKSQWKSRTRNLLPDDKHFNSRQLLRLFLKPKARMGSRRSGLSQQPANNPIEELPEGEVDENYWARNENTAGPQDENAPQGNYNADFFEDGGLPFMGGGFDDDDDEFADAREHFSPPAEGGPETAMPLGEALAGGAEGAFGAQLIAQNRRVRPEYVQYARVAKKVDVRRLKEEMWRNIGFEQELDQSTSRRTLSKTEDDTLKFTDVMNSLQSVYPKQQMDDISTSYCFICLLHLANEKGLVIKNEPEFTELSIGRDHSAEITAGGE